MGVVLSLLALLWLGGAVYVAATTLVLSVERQHPPDLSPRALGRFFREVGAVFTNNLCSPLGLFPVGPRPTDRAGGPPARTPVLLVPGHGRNRTCLFFLAAALRRRGWPWVWPINNTPSAGAIHAMGEALAERVEQLLRVSGAERVDLVCHSMGGVIAAWYINRLGGAERVRRVVTIATPWGGTRLGVLSPRRNGRQLAPASGVLIYAGLPRAPTTAIWTDTDAIIIPPSSANPQDLDTVLLPGMGHEQLLFSPRVVRLVEQALSPEVG